jgi:predicted NUDIX family NTP pyrophosphohydrolase
LPVHSAGILLYRGHGREREVFLVHPGGPFWTKRDEGAWSVPKGIVDPNEDPLAAARREFKEETGFQVDGEFRALGIFRQPSNKRIHVWVLEGDCDPSKLVSNSFDMVWPPKSGRMQSFPEIDRGAWLRRVEALARIVRGQRPILEKFYSDFTHEYDGVAR